MRFRLLKHTRLNVVAFINELPKTQHDIASFNVDVNTFTVRSCLFCQHVISLLCLNNEYVLILFVLFKQNTLLSFTVSGVFKEGELVVNHDFLFLPHPLQGELVLGLILMFLMFVFQLLSMVNPESPPWLSLESSSQFRQGILGMFLLSSQWFESYCCCPSHFPRGKVIRQNK